MRAGRSSTDSRSTTRPTGREVGICARGNGLHSRRQAWFAVAAAGDSHQSFESASRRCEAVAGEARNVFGHPQAGATRRGRAAGRARVRPRENSLASDNGSLQTRRSNPPLQARVCRATHEPSRDIAELNPAPTRLAPGRAAQRAKSIFSMGLASRI